jgi:hypothetical protein
MRPAPAKFPQNREFFRIQQGIAHAAGLPKKTPLHPTLNRIRGFRRGLAHCKNKARIFIEPPVSMPNARALDLPTEISSA